MAKVSVIIPVHNGATTIGRALESVFAQTYSDYETVVVNDGSTDDTAAVLAGYGERISVICQANRGVAAARNAGVRTSSGEYIAFLDDDDEWMPAKLARCVDVLDQDSACGIVYCDVFKVDPKGRPMPNQENQTQGVDCPTMGQMLARQWSVVPSQILTRRSVFELSGGFEERLAIGEDQFFLLRAREIGCFRRVPEPLLRKTTRPLYPKALNREPQSDLFVRLVRERYGAKATGLIREFQRTRIKLMQHMARVLMKEGRPRDARRCLARVIHYQPASPKAYRRYLKTFQPTRLSPLASEREAEPVRMPSRNLEHRGSAPRVSVVVPVYNGAATINRALESIFAQTFTDYETVVVNDGSTDNTLEVLADYNDRIRVISLSNRGASTARNAGVLASSGEYLAFLDADDQWLPQKLERSVAVLDEDPACALVYTRAIKVDQNGRKIGTLDAHTQGLESPAMAQMLAKPWNAVPSQFVVRRAVFERCGGFRVTGCEDIYFLLQAREHGYFRCVREPLVRKTAQPLYPTWLKREARFVLFLSLLRERYGASADGLIAELRSSRANLFKHMARILVKNGRTREARRCLARVIYYEPTSPRAYRKYLKTFIMLRSARVSSSPDSRGV